VTDSVPFGGFKPARKFWRFDGLRLWPKLDVLGCFMMVGIEEAGNRGGPHRSLGREHNVTRSRCRTAREFESRGNRIVGNLEHQAVAFGGFRVERHSKEKGRTCRLGSDGSLQHPGGPASGMYAELLKSSVEHRKWTRDPDVSGERKIHPRANGGSVDRGYRRQAASTKRHETVVKPFKPLLGGGAKGGQIGTGAEGFSGARHYHGMDAWVRFGAFDARPQLFRTSLGDGVSPLRVVDCYQGDTVDDVVEEHEPRLAGNIRRAFGHLSELRSLRSSLGTTIDREGDPMKTVTAVVAAGSALVLTLTLGACGADKKAETSSSSSATSASTTGSSTNIALPSERPNLEGAHKTINDYIVENKIAETPFKPNQPGTPDFDFPFPPDWSPAGDKTPEWAYGAIIYDKPQDPADPPTIIAIASKLTGNVDAAKILEYAPGAIQNLPEYKSVYEPNKSQLGGFEAIQSAGTFVEGGKKRVVAQKTVVVPDKDALFVVQLNAVAPDGQENVILDAAKLIDEQTKITP